MGFTALEYYKMLGWSTSQVRSFVIIPKIMGFLSFSGSLYIVQDVMRNPKKRKSTYYKILLGMSLLDTMGSFFGPFLGTWPMPKGNHLYAIGTVTACDIAGFLHQFGSCGTPFYNCSLVTFYLLLLKYNWSNTKIARVEKYFHIVPWTMCLLTSIPALLLKAYGSTIFCCWTVSAYPLGCDNSPGNECIRGGGNTYLYVWAVVVLMPMICLIYVGVTMGRIYLTVIDVERKAEKHRFVPRFQQKDKKKKKQQRRDRWSTIIWKQGLMYSGALILVWIFPIIFCIIFIISGPNYVVHLLFSIFYPIQGILNFIIYITPRGIDVQQKKKSSSSKRSSIKNSFTRKNPHRMNLTMKTINNRDSEKKIQTHNEVSILNQNEQETILNDKHKNKSLAAVSYSNADDKEVSYNSGEEEKTEIKDNRKVVCFDYEEDLDNVLQSKIQSDIDINAHNIGINNKDSHDDEDNDHLDF